MSKLSHIDTANRPTMGDVGDKTVTERTARARSIVEFPVAILNGPFGKIFPLGGGFFRLFPLAWTSNSLKRYEEADQPGMLYLHPWEIDPGQPRVKKGLKWKNRMRHYARLAQTEGKLARLLEQHRWGTMADALEDLLPVSA